jgi:hypothetical protein
MQGLFFIAGVVLALSDTLTTWWGITIMAVAAFIAAGIASAEANPQHQVQRVEVFTLLFPTIAAFYIGNELWHPWGAIIAALAMNPIGTWLANFLLVRIYEYPIEPRVYTYGDGYGNGRQAKLHARSARRQGAHADYDREEWRREHHDCHIQWVIA